MKFIKIIVSGLVVSLGLVYIALFTPLNKNIVVPIVEKKVSSALKVDEVKVLDFELTINNLKLILMLRNEKIVLNSNFNLFSKTLDASIQINIQDLSLFNKVSGQKLNGIFSTNANVMGTFDNLQVAGNVKVAKGNINYKLQVKDDDIKDIVVGVKKLDLSILLKMVNQPQYAKANINMDVNIKSLNNLDGKILTSVNDGLLNAKFVKQDFNITLPSKPIFNLKATTSLNKNMIITKSILNSFAAKLETTKTIFDINTAILNTDYILSVSNLNRLYFITNQKMKGDIKIIGDVKVDKGLTATFNSNKFDGKINGVLKNNKLNVNIKDINSIQLLNMMNYPEVFILKLDLKLDYDLANKKGESNILLTNGQFLVSQLSQTIKSLIGKDLTAEIYKTTDIKTKIDNLKLDSILFMKSKNSQIKSKKLYVDLNNNYLDSILDMQFFGLDVEIEANGELISPKIKVDVGKVLKSKAKQKIKNDLGGLLKKFF